MFGVSYWSRTITTRGNNTPKLQMQQVAGVDCFFGPLVNFLSFQNEQVYGYKKLNLFCFNATVVHSMRFYTSDMVF